jgi:hypothetical protein
MPIKILVRERARVDGLAVMKTDRNGRENLLLSKNPLLTFDFSFFTQKSKLNQKYHSKKWKQKIRDIRNYTMQLDNR